MVRFGASSTRVVVLVRAFGRRARARGGLRAGRAEAHLGRRRGRRTLLEAPARPLLTVFLPDRLELIKGPPARASRASGPAGGGAMAGAGRTRRAYAQTLAQRNALIARIRSQRWLPRCARRVGRAARPSRHGADGRSRRGGAGDRSNCAAEVAAELGLEGARDRRLPTPFTRHIDRGVVRRAGRAHRQRPGAWVHGSRAPPGRAVAAAGRPRAPDIRFAGPAATRRCWLCCSPSARRSADIAGRLPMHAARRRHERARRASVAARSRTLARGRRPGHR